MYITEVQSAIRLFYLVEMYKVFFVLIVCLCYTHSISAQNSDKQAYIDSLLVELPEAKEDTIKVKVLLRLMQTTYDIDIMEAIQYGEQALEIAEKSGDKQRFVSATTGLGRCYTRKGDYPKALSYLLQSISASEKLKNPEEGVTVYSNIITIYNKQGKYDKSMEYAQKSLSVSKKTNNKSDIAYAYDDVAITYYYKGNLAKALQYMEKHWLHMKKLICWNRLAVRL